MDRIFSGDYIGDGAALSLARGLLGFGRHFCVVG